MSLRGAFFCDEAISSLNEGGDCFAKGARNDIGSVPEAKLLVGGDILTAIDGMPLHNWDDLDAYLQEQTEVGQTVTLTVWRDDQEMAIEVKLGEMPEGL